MTAEIFASRSETLPFEIVISSARDAIISIKEKFLNNPGLRQISQATFYPRYLADYEQDKINSFHSKSHTIHYGENIIVCDELEVVDLYLKIVSDDGENELELSSFFTQSSSEEIKPLKGVAFLKRGKDIYQDSQEVFDFISSFTDPQAPFPVTP